MKRILIVGANPYNDNKGIAALCTATIILLDKIFAAIGRDDIEIAVYNHEFKMHKDSLILSNKKIDFINIYPTPKMSIRNFFKIIFSKWRLYNLKEFLKVTYIVNIAAGDSFADIYGAGHFFSVDNPNRLARFFNKPYLMLPQTFGPFDLSGKFWPSAKKTLEKAKLVIARDEKSYDFVRLNTKQSEILKTIDMAFFLPYNFFKMEEKYVNVGLNVSALLWHGGYTKNNQFGLRFDYVHYIQLIINYFLNKTNCKVHLIPHVVSSYNNIENDYQVSYEIFKEYSHERLVLSPFFLSPIEAKGYISSLDFFLGARMHACIAAYSSNVPLVPMAYSRKFNGLFKDTLNYDFVSDMINMSEDEAIKVCIRTFEMRNKIKDSIRITNETFVGEKEEELIDELSAILKNI